MRTHVPQEAFWYPDVADNCHETIDIIDTTFVDDECIMLMAPSPASLDKAMDAVLEITSRVFGIMHMLINWLPGKSEALLIYRGKRANIHREQWRQQDGSMSIGVPNSSQRLTVVQTYKHLGSKTSVRGDCFENTQVRTNSAMKAFSPLATKFFGSDSIERHHRISMMISLILSRLLFHVHITVPTIRDMKAFNAVHMRVLRRIIGDMRFSADVVHTDRRVRDIL